LSYDEVTKSTLKLETKANKMLSDPNAAPSFPTLYATTGSVVRGGKEQGGIGSGSCENQSTYGGYKLGSDA